VAQQVEVVLVEAQGEAHLLHLFHEACGGPQVLVLGLVRVARAQLVVVDELDALGGQEALEGLKGLVGAAGAAVQQQHLDAGVVAEALGPDLEGTLGGLDGDELHAALLELRGDRKVGAQARRRGLGGQG